MTTYLGKFLELTVPAVEPVTVDEFKREARFASADFDDTLIPLRIKSAREYVEAQTYLVTISRTFTAILDRFPLCGPIEINLVPLVSVEEIRYIDAAGDSQILDPSVYTVQATGKPGLIYRSLGEVWPSTAAVPRAVQIDFTAGHGAAETDVPAELKTAILMVARDRFYQPGPLREDTVHAVQSLRWRHLF